MVVIDKLLYLLTSFLVVSSSPYKKYNQNLTQIGLKIRPVKETVESNIISESQVKYYNSQENQDNTTIRRAEQDKFLHYIWNLMEMVGNNLSPRPSNPHLFTTLKIMLIPKNPSGSGISTTNKRPYVVPNPERTPSTTKAVYTTLIPVSTTSIPVSTTSKPVSTTSKPVSTTAKSVSTTTERIFTTPQVISTTEQYYDDEDTGRPVKFKDTRLFDLENMHKFSRKMPEVEHGSIQYTI
ncbi:PREDICTED: chondroitin proteoglycan 1-like [Papilio polytes]|uniref:chondroitin proteoglycan 1-like n=1 Tax=Papilio polytes TaxID=76194 RepID=UPI000675F189|nr:PREDICTED: chondroitin proteoglycan 1-like [Papilio polytes]XP_013138869.1 PREDICTED: chondroitin proteoglycan 1-like [Papilio polytes]